MVWEKSESIVCAKSLQWCLTLCDPMDCSPPGSSVHGILQARIWEWVAVPSSRGIFLTQASNLHLLCLLHWQVGSLPLALPGKASRVPRNRGAQIVWVSFSLFSGEIETYQKMLITSSGMSSICEWARKGKPRECLFRWGGQRKGLMHFFWFLPFYIKKYVLDFTTDFWLHCVHLLPNIPIVKDREVQDPEGDWKFSGSSGVMQRGLKRRLGRGCCSAKNSSSSC